MKLIINLYYKQKYIKRSILQYDNTLLVRKVFVLKDKSEKYIKWQVSKKKPMNQETNEKDACIYTKQGMLSK